MTSLSSIGFDPFFEAQLGALDGGLVPARIAIAHGESYVSWTRDGVRKAVLSGRRLATWRIAADRPQVGDWVTGTYSDTTGALIIEHLLARRTCLIRRAAGERAEAQIIASNVDVVGIVSAFGDGQDDARDRRLINEGRLRRYLAAVEQSRASPLLIVNKSDLSAKPDEVADGLARLFPGVPIVLMSGQQGLGIERLQPWVRPGQTLALVGMSGVGKSTLVNALLGRDAQDVGAVRESDARGRHTTTHRELFLTESGALLIDTPGMREMGLWEIDDVTSFDDVVALTTACRFTDCRHQTEPGCAIRAALESGALTAERWSSYQQQQQRVSAKGAHARAPSEAHARGRRGRRNR
ncbi:MAG: ribosome biosis GTPase / thiamine phosphate phosphatase [Myxococcales bacterium]|jgi:ribosome biogenesis GTPase|nr:ribosome biosis GTPase / thiamine phosphate phosphatase [Myxococcales bacterium]